MTNEEALNRFAEACYETFRAYITEVAGEDTVLTNDRLLTVLAAQFEDAACEAAAEIIDNVRTTALAAKAEYERYAGLTPNV